MGFEHAVVAVAAAGGAAAALWSGFGLGTVLMPVMAVFFPVETAIASTAAVHLANGLLKALWVGRGADRGVVLSFAPPAIVCAVLGALLLDRLAQGGALARWSAGPIEAEVTALKLVMAAIIGGLALVELPAGLASRPGALYLGGALSGFFGGLSGHQGAFRALFLKNAGLGPERLIGTLALTAIAIDVSRLAVYGPKILRGFEQPGLLAAGLFGSLAGTAYAIRAARKWTSERLLKNIDRLLALFALLLAAGIV